MAPFAAPVDLQWLAVVLQMKKAIVAGLWTLKSRIQAYTARGGTDQSGRAYPILNKNAGSDQGLELGVGWNKPLKSSGKRPTWAVEPTEKRPIKKLSN